MTHIDFKRNVVDSYLRHLTEEERVILARSVYEKYANPEVVSLLETVRNPVITTSCPEAFASRMSLPGRALLIASLSDTHELPDVKNFGAGKVENLVHHFGDESITVDSFYTDSDDDLPLIEYARTAFRVTMGSIEEIK